METRIFKLAWYALAEEDDAREFEFVIAPEPTVINFPSAIWGAHDAAQRVLRKRLRKMVASGKEQVSWIVPSFTQEELAHVKKWILAEAL